MSSSSTTDAAVLASAWTEEKNYAIDWADVSDVLASNYSFLQIVAAHPKLKQHFDAHPQQRRESKELFGSWSSSDEEAKRKMLQSWHHQGLLHLRDERWCKRCGRCGHTRRDCGTQGENEEGSKSNSTNTDAASASAAPTTSKVLMQYAAHRQHVERLKILAEKQNRGARRANDSTMIDRRGQRVAAGGGGGDGSNNKDSRVLEAFTEERRAGIVGKLDMEYKIGFVRVPAMGDVKFFVERIDYGVKSIAVGDEVTLTIDSSKGYPFGIDVRPAKPIISADDATRFLDGCRRTAHPIKTLAMLLSHRREWFDLLGHVYGMRGDVPAYVEAIHTLVQLITFYENREPIHRTILSDMLQLVVSGPPNNNSNTSSASPTSSPAPQVLPFVPDMLLEALSMQAAATTQEPTDLLCSQWIEVANLVVLLRHFQHLPEEHIASTQRVVEATLETLLQHPHPFKLRRHVDGALRRLRLATSESALAVLPTAAELSVPPPLPTSVFAAANLPINGSTAYTSVEAFIAAHCALLRADTFEATVRLLPALCYQLPSYTPTADTRADVDHARSYHHVRYLGAVITKDRQYAHPNSHLLQVQASSAKANLRSQLSQGTTICISTGLDPAVMEDGELFWGTISSCNGPLLQANIIVVSPSEHSTSFDVLASKLERNARMGRSERSMLVETPIFLAGYVSILRALRAFVGPLAMALPLSDVLVGEEAAQKQLGNPMIAAAAGQPSSSSSSSSHHRTKLLSYIPPHCARAFLDLTDDVQARFALDAGQQEVMKRLPTAPVLLVQGPPGTGKSFIGCRLVETYVRYKQLVASGDILQKVSVELLSSIKPEEMLPRVGPIVVITYKNHALDEFLVDLLDSGLWSAVRPRVGQQLAAGNNNSNNGGGGGGGNTDVFPNGHRLVRIGGRSKEGKLDRYNLGTLMHERVGLSNVNSYKERIYVMQQRLDRLTKEIHFLERGRVPRAYFERWLTPEQRKHMSADDREAWLRGERYVGVEAEQVAPTTYMELLRTEVAQALSTDRGSPTTTTATPPPPADADEDVSLSIFQEMKREDESREYNEHLHTHYLSAEALRLASEPPSMPAEVPDELLSLWSLTPRVRHTYYAYLVQKTISAKARDCSTIMEAIKHVVHIRNHAMDEAKLALLDGADVIGLTTTGCAMNQNLLRSLRPSVLVVEEAAEVLESQLLACMTDSLRQIVLIGDHFQLQPKVDTFDYEKINHLNLSLFERLARQSPPIRLTEQRRMHPELSKLVRPFYTEQPLIDHPSLLTRPFVASSGQLVRDRVPGLARRVFFWRHHHPEEEAPGSRSKVNTLEVRMVQQLVSHLTSEGVLQKSITVITPYLGQCRMLRSVLRLSNLADVHVSTVDLFQGDENDIIILSLVRTEKLTEFIRMRNRLIVSCSRARFGMVLVGNDALLRQSAHWAHVLEQLDAAGGVGEKLPITRFRQGEIVPQWIEAHHNPSVSALMNSLEEAS